MVSAIIPARNEEASIARAVDSVSSQPEVGEVIVVDDQSTDRTGEILAALANRCSKLKTLAAGDLPSGWTGKNHAVSVGAAVAQGDWFLFTDADTYHLHGSTRRALADAADHEAALVSYSPDQEMESFWERAVIPFVFCRLAVRFPYSRVNDPRRPDAAANGQFLLVRRDAYDAVGGHAAVSDVILEDVALARRIKKAGYPIFLGASKGAIRTRMYRSFASLWQGWTKNLYPLVGATGGSVLLELIESVPVLEVLTAVVFSLLLLKDAPGSWWFLVSVLLVLLAGRHVQYARALERNLYPISSVQYYVPGAAVYAAMLLASWWKNTRGAVLWKGRGYPARSSSEGR